MVYLVRYTLFYVFYSDTLFGFVIPKGGERYDWLCIYLRYDWLCTYLTTMIWIYASNKFVKHVVEHVQDQRKTPIHMKWFGMIKTKKREL